MSSRRICIVSCTAHKRETAMRAENLYSSELFFKSRRYAHANYDGWLILSAKHGLIDPTEVLAPYDCKLTTLSSQAHSMLAAKVSHQAAVKIAATKTTVTSICGQEYDKLLTDAGINFESKAEFALPIGKKLKALARATDPEGRQELLDQTYKVVGKLARARPLKRLSEIVDTNMPEAGVYLFLDVEEPRLKDIEKLRIVRVGTHGVATGSRASLRNRMRTHFGTLSGDGNHRSSVFRLHTGRSMINAKQARVVATWGSTAVEKNTLLAERALEQAVSKYLSNLYVLLISVPGEASKSNDRAYLEQNLIALLSNNCRPLDPPSSSWLGLHAAKREIRKSGLWNVNHVYQRPDTRFIDVLDYYVSLTIGSKGPPRGSLAPTDWHTLVRSDARQLAFPYP